jgi:hypothetical protein
MKDKKKRVSTRVIVLVFIVIAIILVNIFVYRFAMDVIVIFLLLLAFIFKEQKSFIKEWSIPIILFYLYELLRGKAYVIAQWFNRPIYNEILVATEKKLFAIQGEIPTVFLQYSMSNINSGNFLPHWYDYVFFLFYISFFWFWLIVGFVIWRKSKDMFKRYMYGLVGFSLIDTLIYIFFPSAPPWYASQVGILPSLQRTMLSYDYLTVKYHALVSTYGNNDFAAWPSHHAAWPFFACLFLVAVFGKKAIPFFIIPLVIVFATWYGAEHYIIDSIAGFAIAGITFWIVMNIGKKK